MDCVLGPALARELLLDNGKGIRIMKKRFFLGFLSCAVMAGSASAQSYQRRATITGGGSPDRGKCTIEVVVDKTAEVEIRGNNGILRNLAGQPPQWRRFECSSPLPANPVNFRFAGVDGRGRQDLVRDPRSGGAAVVRIDDPDNGSEGYTFDLIWGGGVPPPPQERREDRYDRDRPRDDHFDRGPRGATRFTVDQAVSVCQDAIRAQARERFRGRDISFRRTTIDDNPGRNDWVVGVVEIHRREGRDDLFRFSCSVNFDNGVVRSANMEPFDDRR